MLVVRLRIFLACLAQLLCCSATDPPYIVTKPHRSVCTNTYAPLAICGPSNASLDEYTGYELELFKAVANVMYTHQGAKEWGPGQWSFVCFPMWGGILDDLAKPRKERICDLAVAGISATAARKLPPLSLKFSYPTIATGRRVMVAIKPDSWLWLFLEPFSTELWVVFFATSVVAALCILVLEMNRGSAVQAMKQPGAALEHYSNVQFASTFLLLHGGYQLVPRSPQGRIVVLGYAFVVVILLNMYIGSMVSILSARASRPRIQSLYDVAFRPTGIFVDEYESLTSQLTLHNVVNQTWQGTADEVRMISDLKDSKLAALLLDAVFVDYQAAGDCELYGVGDLILPVNLAIAFPADVPDVYILSVDVSLSQLDDTGASGALAKIYLTPEAKCKFRADPYAVPSAEVTLYSVGGLWIILAGCVGAGLLWNVTCWLLSTGQARLERRRACKAGIPVSNVLAESRANPGSGMWTHNMALKQRAQAVTSDEALQEVDANLQQVDVLIKHLPFVMAANFDAKLIELRHELLEVLVATKKARPHGPSMDNSAMQASPRGGGLEEHFPMLAKADGGSHVDTIALHLLEQRNHASKKLSHQSLNHSQHSNQQIVGSTTQVSNEAAATALLNQKVSNNEGDQKNSLAGVSGQNAANGQEQKSNQNGASGQSAGTSIGGQSAVSAQITSGNDLPVIQEGVDVKGKEKEKGGQE